jgi:hypothetical protein
MSYCTTLIESAIASLSDTTGPIPHMDTLRQAQAAVTHLVSHATRCDPDGISLYFFSGTYDKHENMCSADDVMTLFHTHQPGGGTKLAKVQGMHYWVSFIPSISIYQVTLSPSPPFFKI